MGSDPADSQGPVRGWLAMGGLDAQMTSDLGLEAAARTFAAAWASGDASAVAGHLAPNGIRLHLEGTPRSALPPRQVSAAIRDFLRGYVDGRAQVTRVTPVAGSPDRGAAEIRWIARVAGTSEPVRRSLFVGLVRDGVRWRVDELRLLP